MNKYTEQQKLDAVESYRPGELGFRKTAELHGVDEPSTLSCLSKLLEAARRTCLDAIIPASG